MDELIKRLWDFSVELCKAEDALLVRDAAEALEELVAEVSRLQLYASNISNLPDCNSCLKKNVCEFRPRPGEYCRINCPAWLGVMDTKEERA